MSYPTPTQQSDGDTARAVLCSVGLGSFAARLNDEERWDRVLSLGEQQCVAFAWLLLHKPAWIFMDEATATLDEPNQDAMMRLVVEKLPGAALISIGHRPGLEVFHARTLTLHRAEGGGRLTLPPRRAKPENRWSIPRIRGALKIARVP